MRNSRTLTQKALRIRGHESAKTWPLKNDSRTSSQPGELMTSSARAPNTTTVETIAMSVARVRGSPSDSSRNAPRGRGPTAGSGGPAATGYRRFDAPLGLQLGDGLVLEPLVADRRQACRASRSAVTAWSTHAVRGLSFSRTRLQCSGVAPVAWPSCPTIVFPLVWTSVM